jgi:hypothetical protein
MEFQAFSSYRPHHASTLDDIPSFEEAFDTNSLRRYYQQQSGSLASDMLNVCTLPNKGTLILDECSPTITDDRDTQDSPLIHSTDRFNHGPQSSLNFDHKFNSEIFARQTSFEELFSYNQPKSLDNMPSQSFSGKFAESRKVIEMKGNMNMTMSFGNITVKGGNQFPLAASRNCSQSTVASEHDEDFAFERLIRSKKIFKIQRDAKPKVALKQKASPLMKTKPVSPSAQTMKQLPFTTIKVPRNNIMNQGAQNQQEVMKNANAPVFNFLQVMQEKGYTPQQIMGEVQRFAQANANRQFSPVKI